jgi:hypothetical protein
MMRRACGTSWAEKSSTQGVGGKPEGKRPLQRPRHGWEDNIKMNLQGGIGDMD